MSRVNRKYTVEFKQEAMALVTKQGLSLSEAARRLGIHVNLLRSWREQSDKGTLTTGETSRLSPLEEELRRLRAENERLRMEREILKKATAFFAKESR